MEQIIEHDMELDNADATVKVLEKALTVFQIAKPLLIVFVLGIQTKKFKRFLDLVNIRRAERKLHADIVLDILVRQSKRQRSSNDRHEPACLPAFCPVPH